MHILSFLILDPRHNSVLQNGYVTEVAYLGHTNFRRYYTKFSFPCDLAPCRLLWLRFCVKSKIFSPKDCLIFLVCTWKVPNSNPEASYSDRLFGFCPQFIHIHDKEVFQIRLRTFAFSLIFHLATFSLKYRDRR